MSGILRDRFWSANDRRKAEARVMELHMIHGGILLRWRSEAEENAEYLSECNPDKVFRVYRTPAGNYWCRNDPEPVAQVDGVDLVHLAAYLNGEKVRP